MPIPRRTQPGPVAPIAPAGQPGAGLRSNLPLIAVMSTPSRGLTGCLVRLVGWRYD
jgi:hypothetical protein